MYKIFEQESFAYLAILKEELTPVEIEQLSWLLESSLSDGESVTGHFIGPRREMVTPWSTNAVSILANMGIHKVQRIEEFQKVDSNSSNFDPMLKAYYDALNGETLVTNLAPVATRSIKDIEAFSREEGLALSGEEIKYLESKSVELGRSFTDAELYAFGQINSEHCRHKIFNGTFVINGERKDKSLFQLIKDTSKKSPDQIVSAYKDNVAFIKGPKIEQFSPERGDAPSSFKVKIIESILSLKAETHNFPTTVEPFNGASTGSGGEIRDRMAGGIGSIPLAGTAVYMTSYPRLDSGNERVFNREWEDQIEERKWKYQTPEQILVKASNGASDFGNKFGQPLINGSLLTYEGHTANGLYAYDRAVMLAGGIGFANSAHAEKKEPQVGDSLVLLGGDNYRIGMAGGSVSSVDTGALSAQLELSAIQRADPEMQKRAFNVVRSLVEADQDNPIVAIHDHGAGGHVNCFTELLESKGGEVDISSLPVGDKSLSEKEIICNESQERMGLIVSESARDLLTRIGEREKSPAYFCGTIKGDKKVVFKGKEGNPIDLPLDVLLGSSPKTELFDEVDLSKEPPLKFNFKSGDELRRQIKKVLSLEGVACKDWLTNKVDRSVTGKVAMQQCCGPLQLPLVGFGISALDYLGEQGIAVSTGHAPIPGLISPAKGARLSVAEALTNIVFAPLREKLSSVVLSANWMWPAKQKHENAKLYEAVEALSKVCIDLGISVPTGKDSLSMTMKYSDDLSVKAPGTVVVTAVGHTDNHQKAVTPDLKPVDGSKLVYINLAGVGSYELGGSSFAQTLNQLGDSAPDFDVEIFKRGFNLIQQLLNEELILAGQDISAGGLITALLEMCFAGDVGAKIDLQDVSSKEGLIRFIFSEQPGVVIQVSSDQAESIVKRFELNRVPARILGEIGGTNIEMKAGELSFIREINVLRRAWFFPSFQFDQRQTAKSCALDRFSTLDHRAMSFRFPANYNGSLESFGLSLDKRGQSGAKAAIIREQGTNGDRELAYTLYLAGFDVRDVTMSDITSGRESLEDINFALFPGGFANSDVLGAGKGWGGVFKYNDRAKKVIERFYGRNDTLSMGICNGCQLVVAMDVLYPDRAESKQPRMLRNISGRFESTFLSVTVQQTNSVFLKDLVGTKLGIWVAHGEGRFSLPGDREEFNIPIVYSSSRYPMCPNGADFSAAAISSLDGRHLAIMPHLERSIFPWQWGYYPYDLRDKHQVSPWMTSFVAAKDWLLSR